MDAELEASDSTAEFELGDNYVVGTKQTLKAIKADRVSRVFVARDADNEVVRPVLEACREKQLEPTIVASRRELGRLCHIDVGAAAAAILKEDIDP